MKHIFLSQREIADFYNPKNPGVIILRNKIPSHIIAETLQKMSPLQFIPKEYQHINNGQSYHTNKSNDTDSSDALLIIYETIQKNFPRNIPDTTLEYGFTKYPISSCGAAFHTDFSYNMNSTITFFFGSTTLCIADNKSGLNSKKYILNSGDILIMRAPRNHSVNEIKNRPIHSIGPVFSTLYTFETREVDIQRKKLLIQNLKE